MEFGASKKRPKSNAGLPLSHPRRIPKFLESNKVGRVWSWPMASVLHLLESNKDEVTTLLAHRP